MRASAQPERTEPAVSRVSSLEPAVHQCHCKRVGMGHHFSSTGGLTTFAEAMVVRRSTHAKAEARRLPMANRDLDVALGGAAVVVDDPYQMNA